MTAIGAMNLMKAKSARGRQAAQKWMPLKFSHEVV
jgi:hypothetical protein